MSPITHFLTSWLIANASVKDNRRERAVITLAGVAPDLDGLGLIADLLTANSERPLSLYADYHHLLGHNIGFGLFTASIAFFLATRRWPVVLLSMVSFHLHLVSDLAGSRGPDGYQWPIPYLMPFSNGPRLTWDGQWELNAWPNFVVTAVALGMVFILAWKRGYSPLEMISRSADRALVSTLRKRFRARTEV
jgi:hypothetical protein